MVTLKTLLTRQIEEQKAITDTEGDLKKRRETSAKTAKAIQAKVKGGQSTGDPIRDFLLSRYGSVNEKIRLTLLGLNSRVERCSGEYIVAAYTEYRPSFHGARSVGNYHPCTKYFLGVLSGKTLVFDLKKGVCAFPTDGIVQGEAKQASRIEGATRLMDGVPTWPFVDWWALLAGSSDEAQNLKRVRAKSHPSITEDDDMTTIFGGMRGHLGDGGRESLSFLIGDNEVYRYMVKENGAFDSRLVTFWAMGNEIGRPIKEAPAILRELRRDFHWLAMKLQRLTVELDSRREEAAAEIKAQTRVSVPAESLTGATLENNKRHIREELHQTILSLEEAIAERNADKAALEKR